MKIELKNIKHAEFASQETHCYEASLYVDGRRVAHVSNDGHGGCDMVHVLGDGDRRFANNKLLHDAKQYLSRHIGYGPDAALEIHCADLVNDWLLERDIKKAIKRRILFQKPDNNAIFQCKAQWKPTKENIAHLRTKQPDWIVLNDKPLDELVQIWRAAQ